MTVFHFLTYNMCNVDDLDESDFEDMENDDDIVTDKDVTEVDDDLDFEDDNRQLLIGFKLKAILRPYEGHINLAFPGIWPSGRMEYVPG